MGWEVRNGQRYYYEKRRVDGRVRSVYVGSGDEGQQASQQAEQRKAEERTAKKARKEARAELERVEQAIGMFGSDVSLVVEACLLLNGYRLHGGEVRKIR